MSTVLHFTSLWQVADPSALRSLGQKEERRLGRHFIAECLTSTMRVRAHLLLGEPAEAAEVVRSLEEQIASGPFSMLNHCLNGGKVFLALDRGAFEEALELSTVHLRQARAAGVPLVGMIRMWWVEGVLEAHLGRMEERPYSWWEARRVKALAHDLANSPFFGPRCLGHRGLALVYLHLGQEKAARQAAREALHASSSHANAQQRRLCLETAKRLGVMPMDLDEELVELRGRSG